MHDDLTKRVGAPWIISVFGITTRSLAAAWAAPVFATLLSGCEDPAVVRKEAQILWQVPARSASTVPLVLDPSSCSAAWTARPLPSTVERERPAGSGGSPRVRCGAPKWREQPASRSFLTTECGPLTPGAARSGGGSAGQTAPRASTMSPLPATRFSRDPHWAGRPPSRRGPDRRFGAWT